MFLLVLLIWYGTMSCSCLGFHFMGMPVSLAVAAVPYVCCLLLMLLSGRGCRVWECGGAPCGSRRDTQPNMHLGWFASPLPSTFTWVGPSNLGRLEANETTLLIWSEAK